MLPLDQQNDTFSASTLDVVCPISFDVKLLKKCSKPSESFLSTTEDNNEQIIHLRTAYEDGK